MASLEISGDDLVLRLTTGERFGALKAKEVRSPLSAITSARSVDSAIAEVRGLRAPGTAWPGVIKLGTWRTRNGKSMVAVHGKGPGCVVEFASGPFSRWIVSEPLPEGI